MPKKAEVKIVVKLHSPEGQWCNVEDATYEDDKALSAFCIQRVAKILGEGGILEVKGPFSYEFITMNRIVSIAVTAEEQKISISTDVNSAALEASQTANAEKLIRQPGTPIQFRKRTH